MEITPSCGAIYGILAVWRKNHRGDPKTRNLRFTVAWRSVAPLPLWSQNRKHAVQIRLYFSKPDIEIPGESEKRTKNFGEGYKDG